MKYLIITSLLSVLTISSCFAQQLDRSLIASTGFYNQEGNVKLHFAIGETAISRHQNDIVLTEGFYQDARKMPSSVITNQLSVETSLYPNPATHKIVIDIEAEEKHNVEVYNSLGQVVLHPHSFVGQCDLNISTWPLGQYFIKISNSHGRSNIHTFIKV